MGWRSERCMKKEKTQEKTKKKKRKKSKDAFDSANLLIVKPVAS
jgi:hypothetical protein